MSEKKEKFRVFGFKLGAVEYALFIFGVFVSFYFVGAISGWVTTGLLCVFIVLNNRAYKKQLAKESEKEFLSTK